MALEVEQRHYGSVKDDLLRHHEGKFVLIVKEDVLGVFDDAAEAYKFGLQERGNVPMLIKRVVRDEPTEELPALSLGLLNARL
jgi:hypothetical protein